MNGLQSSGLATWGFRWRWPSPSEFPGTVGFDINEEKVASLEGGVDRTGEVQSEELQAQPPSR